MKREGTFIVCYNTKTKKRKVILTDFGKDKIFPFTKDTIISSILKYENMLIFHDKNQTDPFKINLSKTNKENIYYETPEDAMLIKAQPDMPNTVVGYDSNLAASTFNNNVFWFALRYKYEDGEVSAISPYSGPKLTIEKDNDEINDDTEFGYEGKIDNIDQVAAFMNINFSSLFRRAAILENTFQFTYLCCPNAQKMYISYLNALYSYDAGVTTKILDAQNAFGNGALIAVGTDAYDNVKILAYMIGSTSEGAKLSLYKFKNNQWENVLNKYDLKYSGAQLFSHHLPHAEIALSSFGNIGYVGSYTCVLKSENNGEIWNLILDTDTIDTKQKISSLCCSADGSIVYLLMISEDNIYYLYQSRDFGKNFTKITQVSGATWPLFRHLTVSCSADGRVVHAVDKISKDFGQTFHDTQKGYGTVSSTGKNILIYNRDNYIYVSKDYGDTFSTYYDPNNSSITLDLFYKNFTGDEDDNNDFNRDKFSRKLKFPVHKSSISQKYFLNDISNYVDIEYNTGSKHVTGIEILMKKGTSMYVIANIDKKNNLVSDNVLQIYKFTNTELYKLVASKDVLKLFDNVPLSAGTSTIIQNSLMFGNYVEGFDVENLPHNITLEIINSKFESGDITLKTGTKQRYGIVYYDHFGRCTPVLNSTDIYIDNIRQHPGQEKRIALVKIDGMAPDWAVKYKIARGTPSIVFDMIIGFDNIYAVNNRLYLEITGYPWIVPKSGDYIELISDIATDDTPELLLPVFEFYDNSGHTSVSIKLSDGSHVTESRTEYTDPVPPGRYIIVNAPDVDGYRYNDVLNDKSKYGSSNFYIVYENSTIGDVLFNEIPYEFEIKNKLHKGNQKDQESVSDYAECLLEYDGDAILMKNPTRELNRYPNQTVFTTLGRTVGKVENYRRIHRFAGLCVSEPYVDDTKYNGLSSFNNALVNYKDLEKNHREIELIDGYDTNVEVYQRDKVSNVQYRKNILTTASGDKQVTQSSDIFGEQQMYAPDYGMDNFRSYAKSGNARYFVDSDRGAILRKDLNGIIPVSNFGMSSFLFKELANNGSVAGVFDARHDSYVLCLRDYAINFLEAANGWSSFFEFIPDAIVNTNSGVFSFKKGVLYKHDSLEGLSIYDEDKALVVKFICNDYRDVIKVFNAIMLESSVMPFRVIFNTDAGQSVIDAGYFRKEEGVFLSHIPMCANKAEYVLAGICPENYKGNEIPLINHNFSMVHMGDEVHIMGSPDGTEEYKGKIIGLSASKIILDKRVDISAGSYILCHDPSQVNGEMARGKYMEVEMFFRSAGRILVKSIQIDIDESKV